jgi:hypothetical protein
LPTIYDWKDLTSFTIYNRDYNRDVDLNVSIYKIERYQSYSLSQVNKETQKAVKAYRDILARIPMSLLGNSSTTHTWLQGELNKLENVNGFTNFMHELNDLARAVDKSFDLYKRGNFGINKNNQAVLIDPLFDMKFNRYLYPRH